MTRITVAALALPLLWGACASAGAAPIVDLQLVDRASGQILTRYEQGGRSYVAGRPAARYAVRLVNHSAERVLVVLAVDGINAVTGQTADWGQTGYVLDPWRTADITGWRKSDTAVAAFEFAAPDRSYAARTGRPDNVGVIGIAIFREQPRPPVAYAPAPRYAEPEATDRPAAAAASPAAAAKAERADGPPRSAPAIEPTARLGTAHGAREWSAVTQTRFERLTSTPQSLVEIAYDSLPNLIAAGIVPAPVAQWRPRPFPLNTPGYVPDPPR
ncbi:MAG: hypothetical protein KGN16_21440 [Burkholderiales bacterium]|nr:hypothetical protein [Burkholderiales bacterium]